MRDGATGTPRGEEEAGSPGLAQPIQGHPEELAALPFDEEDWPARTQTRSIGGETGYTVLERLWERHALEVIALVAGNHEGVSRAVIPSRAAMDLSIRTVVGQKVHEVADQEACRTPGHPAAEALPRQP
ncbi:hypothetical protein ACFYE1_13715 [Kocuria sp. CPCC 205315]